MAAVKAGDPMDEATDMGPLSGKGQRRTVQEQIWKMKVADIDDAIGIANAIPFGLGSSVWTSDPAGEARFIRDVQAGMTAVNRLLSSAPEAPFGGVKRSGHGRELGPCGLHEFMNLKSVCRAG